MIGQRPAKQELKKFTDVLQFGKYKGHSVEFVLNKEPSYIVWLEEEGVCKVSSEIYDEAQDLDDYDYQDDGMDMWDYMAD